jgi:hypothetical protein
MAATATMETVKRKRPEWAVLTGVQSLVHGALLLHDSKKGHHDTAHVPTLSSVRS